MKKLFLILLVFVSTFSNQAQTWNLEQCIAYAVENNLTVKQAELNRTASELYWQQSRNAFLPEVSANASQRFSNEGNSASLGADASLLLYAGGRQLNTARQDKLTMLQNDLYVQEAKKSITLSLTEAYIQALFYREGLQTAENNLAASVKQYEQAKAKFEVGSLAAKGLADVESQKAANEYQVIAAKNNYAQQLLTIKQLLELSPEQEFNIIIPDIKSDTLLINDKMAIYQKAIASMPEIEASQLQVDISKTGLALARNGYFPSLSMNAGVGSNQNSNMVGSYTTQLNSNFNQYVGVSLKIPVFSKFNNRTSVQNAKIQIDKSQIQLTSTQKELYRKVEQAWMNAFSSQSELKASDVSRKAAHAAFLLAQQQFALGAVSAADLLVSQSNWLNAEQKYIQTKYTCLLYYQLLQFYQGEAIKL